MEERIKKLEDKVESLSNLLVTHNAVIKSLIDRSEREHTSNERTYNRLDQEINLLVSDMTELKRDLRKVSKKESPN